MSKYLILIFVGLMSLQVNAGIVSFDYAFFVEKDTATGKCGLNTKTSFYHDNMPAKKESDFYELALAEDVTTKKEVDSHQWVLKFTSRDVARVEPFVIMYLKITADPKIIENIKNYSGGLAYKILITKEPSCAVNGVDLVQDYQTWFE